MSAWRYLVTLRARAIDIERGRTGLGGGIYGEDFHSLLLTLGLGLL